MQGTDWWLLRSLPSTLLLFSCSWKPEDGCLGRRGPRGRVMMIEPGPLVPVPAGTAGGEPEKGQADFGWVRHSLAQVCPDHSMGSRQLAEVHHGVGETYEQMNKIGFCERGDPEIAQKTLCLAVSGVGWTPDQLTKKGIHQPPQWYSVFLCSPGP